MRAIFPLAVVVAMALAAPPALAGCSATTSEAAVAEGGFYVVADECLPLCLGVFVYQETNNIDGLQRADDGHDDTCGGTIDADILVV